MRKKLLSALLALAMVTGLLAVPASALTVYVAVQYSFKVVDIHGNEVDGATVSVANLDPSSGKSTTSTPSKGEIIPIFLKTFSYNVSAEDYETVTVEGVTHLGNGDELPENWEKQTAEDGTTVYQITVTLERPDTWEEPKNDDLKDEKDENAVVNGFWGVKVSGFKAGFFYTIRIASSTAQDNTSVIIPLSGKDVAGTTYTFQCKKGQVITVNEYQSPDVLNDTESGGEVQTITSLGDNKYSFTMPGSAVTVDVAFVEEVPVPVNPFVDVQPGTYYYDAVLWAVENGITNGTSETTFSPNSTVTRGQVVTFQYRAARAQAAAGSNPFVDVDDSAYYADAVLWAVNNGITNGTSASTFSPNNGCTRGQIVTFLYRADPN